MRSSISPSNIARAAWPLAALAAGLLATVVATACTDTQLAGGNGRNDAEASPSPSPSTDEEQSDGTAQTTDTDSAAKKHDSNHDTFTVTKAKGINPSPPPLTGIIVPLIPIIPVIPVGPPTPPPVTSNITANLVQPDARVDGEEVINDCSRCLTRAQLISPQAGFIATQALSVNLGYYKVDPSYGLCDIHFLAGPDVPIADHIGQTSILFQQVAVYCPCNCGWAATGY